jgi:GT2 family glycosyltransferase
VVVSDGSSDGTDEYLRKASYPFHLVFVSQPNSGPAAARNEGTTRASGDIILFIDDDVVADPHLVSRHSEAHRALGEGGVVIGPMLTPDGVRLGRYARWEQAMLYKQYDSMSAGRFAATFRQFYTGNASLERELLLAVGGFDERFRRAEDIELAYRLGRHGARFHYDRTAIGFHYAERSHDSWIGIARAYGENEVHFIREYREQDRLAAIHWEFMARNKLVRFVTRACVGRRPTERIVERSVSAIAAGADALRLEKVLLAALSLAYNTAFYSSLAEAMGGREVLTVLLSPCGPDDFEHTLDLLAKG